MIAHIGGLPLEEALPALMSGAGAWLVLKMTSLGSRLRTRPAQRRSAERSPS